MVYIATCFVLPLCCTYTVQFKILYWRCFYFYVKLYFFAMSVSILRFIQYFFVILRFKLLHKVALCHLHVSNDAADQSKMLLKVLFDCEKALIKRSSSITESCCELYISFSFSRILVSDRLISVSADTQVCNIGIGSEVKKGGSAHP